jgi:hypothetical protein
MNIGVAEVYRKGAKMKRYMLHFAFRAMFKKIIQSSCDGWCGESHTLPYAGYATVNSA